MRIAVARETDAAEPRVAATPETVKKLKALGAEVTVEPGAGTGSGIPDSEFVAAGATISMDAAKGADVVLRVRRPNPMELAGCKPGAIVMAIMDPYGHDAALNDLMERHATPIFQFLCRMLGNEDDANDAAQETFARVYRARSSFRLEQKFSTWCYTIAANLAQLVFA